MEQVGYFQSPVGMYEIKADDDGITSIALQGPTTNASKQGVNENNLDKLAECCPSSQHIRDCMTWLDAYFSDSSSLAKVKLPELNTGEHEKKPFYHKVWEILKDNVRAGETVSYADLANMAANPKGARAVGSAMKSNPISIIVPCHRVVKSNGDLGNYSSYNGVVTKEWLLQHEGAIKQN